MYSFFFVPFCPWDLHVFCAHMDPNRGETDDQKGGKWCVSECTWTIGKSGKFN